MDIKKEASLGEMVGRFLNPMSLEFYSMDDTVLVVSQPPNWERLLRGRGEKHLTLFINHRSRHNS